MRIRNLVACIVAFAAVVRAVDPDVLAAGKALAAALAKIGLPKLDSLTGDNPEIVSALSTVSEEAHRSAKKSKIEHLPQCFGRDGVKSTSGNSLNLEYAPFLALFDNDKCTLNGLLALLPEARSSNSAFTDWIVGPAAWSKFMIETFNGGSCNSVPMPNCTFEATKGMCITGLDGSCTPSVYSVNLFPLIPKYTCPGSIFDSIFKCWKQASISGVCDGACAPLPDGLPGILATIGTFQGYANDPALPCWPTFNGSETAQVVDGFNSFITANLEKASKPIDKNTFPWKYPTEFTSIFGTNDAENGLCEGDRAAQLMFYDTVSLQKGDQSWLGMRAHECDETPFKRPFTARRCKKIGGTRYTFDVRKLYDMIPAIPFDPTEAL